MKSIIKFLRWDIGRIIVSAVLFALAFISELLSGEYIALALFILSWLFAGTPVLIGAVRGILRRDLLDEKFLMCIASIGAFIIGEWSEGVAVILFFLVGEAFEHRAVRRSRNSIRALMNICPDEACVLIDDREEIVDAEDVAVGSTIIIRPGERVPIDCEIISGSADVDTSSVTGESVPRSVSPSDHLDSGVVVINGLLTCKTLREAGDSAAARILMLVENANEAKSKEESFITKFSHFYTPAVVISAILLVIILSASGIATLENAIYRALMFLVISCPCALVISVPMAFFGGIGGAASAGILYKGGNVFSAIARADSFAFDKTGTVTTGKFAISDIKAHGIEKERLILLCASAECGSNHPIALSVRALVKDPPAPESLEEIAGEGVVAIVLGERVAVGNSALMRRLGITVPDRSASSIWVSVNGALSGEIIISDDIKSEAACAMSELSSIGAKRLLMLSGDRRESAERVAKSVGISEVYSELSPENKFDKLGEVISSSRKTVYVGDGINDAPSLALADVGVAMGGIGQDSAIEAADVVIMSDDLRKLPEAVLIARKTVGIAKANIVFALGVKLLILILGAFNIANMWLAVFADVGVAVLAIINSMRALKSPVKREKKREDADG